VDGDAGGLIMKETIAQIDMDVNFTSVMWQQAKARLVDELSMCGTTATPSFILTFEFFTKPKVLNETLLSMGFDEYPMAWLYSDSEVIYYLNRDRGTLVYIGFDYDEYDYEEAENGESEDDPESFRIECVSHSKEHLQEIKKALDNIAQEPETKSKIFMIIRQGSSLALKDIGWEPQEYIPENYDETNQIWFDKIVENVTNSRNEPGCGRLTLLKGPPGTGKTTYIGALVSQIDAIFVYCDSHTFRNIVGPDLLALFIDVSKRHSKNKNKPLVFLLEDAEELLVQRGQGDRSAVEILLSVTDSFITRSLDIHVFATTNERLENIDSAIRRDGRMFTHLSFDPLPASHAQRILHRELRAKGESTNGVMVREPMTLAEIYMRAKNHKKKDDDAKKRRKVGF
jgi:hypothetical protein